MLSFFLLEPIWAQLWHVYDGILPVDYRRKLGQRSATRNQPTRTECVCIRTNPLHSVVQRPRRCAADPKRARVVLTRPRRLLFIWRGTLKRSCVEISAHVNDPEVIYINPEELYTAARLIVVFIRQLKCFRSAARWGHLHVRRCVLSRCKRSCLEEATRCGFFSARVHQLRT